MIRDKIYMVIPTDDYKVYVHYDNGEIRLYDASWILEKSEVFEQIKDIEVFKEICTVMNDTLAWDISRCRDRYNCIDICTDTVYEDSIKVSRGSVT
ncbi:MAG TPA: DUF2442 domain-containing protein [Clostridia bacterium]|nr:DUF2442 domain-containing protein [Clostridia bacterium]